MEDSVKKKREANLKAINKRFGDRTIISVTDERISKDIEAIPTGSLALDRAIGIGGIPRGRIVEIFGGASSAKTTLAQHMIAEAQIAHPDLLAGFIDMENALSLEYIQACGVDIDKDHLHISQPDGGEDALTIVEMMVKSGLYSIIVIDSVAALVPTREIEGDMGDAQMGVQARLMSQAMRKLSGPIKRTNTCVVFINQTRSKIGVMYGCFNYDARVETEKGSAKIGNLVNSNYRGKVKSYNLVTGEFEWKNVINTFDNGVHNNNFLQLIVSKSYGNGVSKLPVTPNHSILTKSGFVPADTLKIGDSVMVKSYALVNSDDTKSFVVGSLFGDGSVWETSKGSYRLRFGHELNQRDYLRWKYSLLEDVSERLQEHQSRVLSFDTTSVQDLSEYYDLFYHRAGQYPSEDAVNLLDAKALAVWFMDAGTFDNSRQYRASISCRRFPEYIRDLVVSHITDILGIPCKAHGGSIVFPDKQSVVALNSVIGRYVHPSMQYKLLHGHSFDWDFKFAITEQAVEGKVIDIYNKPKTHNMRKFDLQVEDNGTYVVDGVVVHNSPETTTGGAALKFYSSVRIRLSGRVIKPATRGGKPEAIRVKAKMVKNKVGAPYREAEFDVFFGEGIDKVVDTVRVARDLGIIQLSGSFYKFKGENIGQGEARAVEYLTNNPEEFEELYTIMRAALDTTELEVENGEVEETEDSTEEDNSQDS